MAYLDLASFKAKYTGNGGSDIFRDAKPIVAANDREFAGDIADSFTALSTIASTSMWKPVYVKAKTIATLGVAYTVTTVNGITRITSNSNGTFASQVGQIDNISISVGDSILVSEESTAFYNGCYYLENAGTPLFQPWVLRIRDDSDTGPKTTNAIYYIEYGQRNGKKFFIQSVDNSAGSITNIQYSDLPGMNKRRLKRELTTSEILSGFSSNVQLLPAPSSGNMYKISGPIIAKFKGSNAFTTNTSFRLYYDVAATGLSFTNTNSSLLASSGNTIRFLTSTIETSDQNVNKFEAKGIYFCIDVGNPGGGSGSTLVIEFEYEIIRL